MAVLTAALAVSRRTLKRSLLIGASGLGILLLALGFVVALGERPAASAPPPAPPERTYFRIATGAVSGTYFPIGEAMARLLTQPLGAQPCEAGTECGVEGVTAVATASDGSVANVQLVEAGLVESALTQADVAAAAFRGEDMFASQGPYDGLRAIASLYPEALHLVVAKDSAITGIADLRGKRVAIDRARSGSNAEARALLRAFGLGGRDIQLSDAGVDEAADLLAAGQLDAFFFMGGWPIRLISELIQRNQARLVPIEGRPLDGLIARDAALKLVAIPAGTYPGTGEIVTLGTTALWITRADMPAPLVRSLCLAFWRDANRRLLEMAHPAGRMIAPVYARDGLTIPLHAGAESCYKELGIGDPALAALALKSAGPPTPRKRPATPPSPVVTQ